MKAYWVFGIALAAGMSAHAGECTVVAYAHSEVVLSAGMLPGAEMKATAMFREIGVELRWRHGDFPANAPNDACGAPIVVQLDATARGGRFSPDALAYATPFAESATCIHVFLDRVLESKNERLETVVLAHVLAHEITHVLEVADRHSKEGVMKAHWTGRDFRNMAWRGLPFAAEDVELIHLGIASRMNRMTRAAAE